MSESEDYDTGGVEDVLSTEPVRLNSNKALVNVVRNLAAVYQSKDSTTRIADIDIRRNKLIELGVNDTWSSEDELMGRDGKTPWIELYDVASKPHSIYESKADEFRKGVDLRKPIYNPGNLRLLLGIADPSQRIARQEAEEKRQKKLLEVQKFEESEQLKESLGRSVTEAEKRGADTGKRLANMIYDEAQRKEVEKVLNTIVELERTGIIKDPVERVRQQVLYELDKPSWQPNYDKSSLSRTVFSLNYVNKFKEDFRKAHGKPPTDEEANAESQKVERIRNDLAVIRNFERSDGLSLVPHDVISRDFDVRLRDGMDERTFQQEMGKLEKERGAAYRKGFSHAYNEIKSGNQFTDENRPWFIPKPGDRLEDGNIYL